MIAVQGMKGTPTVPWHVEHQGMRGAEELMATPLQTIRILAAVAEVTVVQAEKEAIHGIPFWMRVVLVVLPFLQPLIAS